MLHALIQGFILQATLILALGAQNIFVLDSGLRRNNHLLIATICSICDVILILLGVLGVSALLVHNPIFKIIIGIAGTIFLVLFAFTKLKEAYLGNILQAMNTTLKLSKSQSVLSALSFTLLNPHVYLDTFFLVGGYSTRFLAFNEKLFFGVGAALFSTIWFYFLAIFSSYFRTILMKEGSLRFLALLTGVTLLYLSFSLGREAVMELTIFIK